MLSLVRLGQRADPLYASILALHNQYRLLHRAGPLRWSSRLQQDASAWAAGCRFEHDPETVDGEARLSAFGVNCVVLVELVEKGLDAATHSSGDPPPLSLPAGRVRRREHLRDNVDNRP